MLTTTGVKRIFVGLVRTVVDAIADFAFRDALVYSGAGKLINRARGTSLAFANERCISTSAVHGQKNHCSFADEYKTLLNISISNYHFKRRAALVSKSILVQYRRQNVKQLMQTMMP